MVSGRVIFGAFTVALAGAAGLVWANWNRGVTVVLRNRDSTALSDVVIHVTGRDYRVGDIPAGATRQVVVDPIGESHIEISQRHPTGRGRLPVECYFEAGYSGTIDVDVTRTEVTVAANDISVGLW